MSDIGKIAEGLWKAASMSADELSAKKGENDLFVKIKRNHERLDACTGHKFEAQPNWRDQPPPYINRTVHCRNCGGDMKMGDAMNYLKGFAHGTGGDYRTMTDAIWPPKGATP